ncbi:hypothetical protein M9458_019300, partial [Cirrhinus mrigala]
EAFSELRTATDLGPHATKATAQAISKTMASLVVLKRHLWLKLTEIRDAENMAFLDSPILPKIPPSLREPLRNGVSFLTAHVLQVQQVPEYFTTVIADPHTIKSRFPLHTLRNTLAIEGSPTMQGEPSIAKIDPLASCFKVWAGRLGVSTWVLNIIRQGYLLQFARRLSRSIKQILAHISYLGLVFDSGPEKCFFSHPHTVLHRP